jgi:GldM C-terminal domain
MKIIFQLFLLSFISSASLSQHIAVSADKNNILYIGVDNPISITVEGISCNDIIVKTDNGSISKYKNCSYSFRGSKPGRTDIILYKKVKAKLKEIGRRAFRLKNIPVPSFYIAQYGSNYFYSDFNNKGKANKVALAAQQYVRAELENFDFQANFLIDSFSVKIFSGDSCKTKLFFNISNKISQQITDAFSILKNDDIVIFHKIYAKAPDGSEWELAPLILTIKD